MEGTAAKIIVTLRVTSTMNVAQRRNLLSAYPRSELSITAELKGTKPNTDEHAYLRYHQTDVRKAFLSN
jgi:hypothetical protein